MGRSYQIEKMKVLVIEPNGLVRTAMSDALKALGFTQIRTLPNLKDALNTFDEFRPDWMVSESLLKESINLLHFLRLAIDVPLLKGTRVSMLISNPEDKYILPAAYQLGLFSHHTTPASQENAKEVFNELLQKHYVNANDLLTSADYLRQVLIETEEMENWVAMEKKIISLHPGRMDLLVNLATPLTRMGDFKSVKNVYQQLLTVSPKDAEKVRDTAIKHGFDPGTDENAKVSTGQICLQRVVVVDPDDAVLNGVRSLLLQAGAKEVHTFETGRMAVEYLRSHPNPDLIIQEWRIPDFQGPIFLQRVRAEYARSCPIIIISGLIRDTDSPLTKEMGVSAICPKPINPIDFLKTIIWTMQQEIKPYHHSVLERKIRDHLRSGKLAEAKALFTDYKKNTEADPAHALILDAEISFYSNDLTGAREKAIAALRKSSDITVLNLLGKILMNVNEHTMALKCFEKAQTLSPQNIERLCLMAEANAELGQEEKAVNHLKTAKNLDKDNRAVVVAEANVALSTGHLDQAKGMINSMERIDEIIAFTNNQAVALTKCDLVDKALEKYQGIMKIVPPNKTNEKSILLYNFALAQIKHNESASAAESLKQCVSIAQKPLLGKARSLLNRLNDALKSGEPLQLRTNESAGEVISEQQKRNSLESTARNMVSGQRLFEGSLPIKVGEHACYLVYVTEQVDERVVQLMKAAPIKELRYLLNKISAA